MRKRINRSAICSSENYEASKRVHIKSRFDVLYDELRENNESRTKLFFIKVFGKTQYIDESSVEQYKAHGATVYTEYK